MPGLVAGSSSEGRSSLRWLDVEGSALRKKSIAGAGADKILQPAARP